MISSVLIPLIPQLAQVVVGIASIYCGGACCLRGGRNGCNEVESGASTASTHFEQGYIRSVSAAAFQAVAQGYAGADWATTGGSIGIGGGAHISMPVVLLHWWQLRGAAGGVMSVLQGGKFGHGFASAGFSKLASPFLPTTGIRFKKGLDIGPVAAAAAIIGGTASLGRVAGSSQMGL